MPWTDQITVITSVVRNYFWVTIKYKYHGSTNWLIIFLTFQPFRQEKLCMGVEKKLYSWPKIPKRNSSFYTLIQRGYYWIGGLKVGYDDVIHPLCFTYIVNKSGRVKSSETSQIALVLLSTRPFVCDCPDPLPPPPNFAPLLHWPISPFLLPLFSPSFLILEGGHLPNKWGLGNAPFAQTP